MIVCAAVLIGRHGVAGTSLGSVVELARAPRGSVYHHFPAGRSQLFTEATGFAGDELTRWVAAGPFDTPAALASAFVEPWRRLLTASRFTVGCPVGAAAQAGGDEPEVEAAGAAILLSWIRLLAVRLRHGGIDDDRCERLAGLLVSATQGAVVRCRAERSTAALDDVPALLF